MQLKFFRSCKIVAEINNSKIQKTAAILRWTHVQTCALHAHKLLTWPQYHSSTARALRWRERRLYRTLSPPPLPLPPLSTLHNLFVKSKSYVTCVPCEFEGKNRRWKASRIPYMFCCSSCPLSNHHFWYIWFGAFQRFAGVSRQFNLVAMQKA